MVSMAVLLVFMLSMIAIVPATLGYASESSTRIQAVGAAQDYLDTVRQYIKTNGEDTNLPRPPVIPIEAGNGFFSTGEKPDLGNFVETPKCTARSLFSFDCTVTVSWSEAGVAHSVKVESFVASQTGF
jgi:Tfp pilus assembly protein PilV